MYVRTKNRIYQVESTLRDNGFVKGYNVGEMAFIRKDQVIKQAETIEELCDELFVYVSKQNEDYEKIEMPIIDITRNLTSLIKIANDTNSVVLGIIWTSKGLIYVAKMNEKGELELI